MRMQPFPFRDVPEPFNASITNPNHLCRFTAKNGADVSFVDAPVKQDVARATLLAEGPVVVSAASGVATGNELRLGGK